MEKMDKICIRYIQGLLELTKTKLECINLGYSQSKETNCEIDLIKQSQDLMKRVEKKWQIMRQG